MFTLKKKKMRNTLKQNEKHSQINIYIYIYICSTFKPKKKKNCNRVNPQKSPTSILNVKQTQSKQTKKKTTQQMVNR